MQRNSQLSAAPTLLNVLESRETGVKLSTLLDGVFKQRELEIYLATKVQLMFLLPSSNSGFREYI